MTILLTSTWTAIALISHFRTRLGHGWILLDVAVPWDKNIVMAEQAKIQRMKSRKLYQAEAQVVPFFVAGVLTAISWHISDSQDLLVIPDTIDSVQMAALIEIARVLGKYCS